MNPIADLRASVLHLDQVLAETPVELTVALGAPSSIVYDAVAGVVRLTLGSGRAIGRPSMGQLRAWLGLPAAAAAAAPLSGVWDSLRATEPATFRGILTLVSAVASGYHGVVRNGGSIGWGLVWFGMGAALPGFVPMLAVAQGFAECQSNCRVELTERR